MPKHRNGNGRSRHDARRATPLDKFIGERIKHFRLRADLSQTALGEKIGITFQQLQKYERGENRVSASRLYQIAIALGHPVTSFFRDTAGRPPNGKSDPLVQLAGDRHSLRVADALTSLDTPGKRLLAQLAEGLAQ